MSDTWQGAYVRLEEEIDDLRAQLAAVTDRNRARIGELEGQCVRWEAMYEGMMAERDGYWEDQDAAEARIGELEGALRAYCSDCYEVGKHGGDCPRNQEGPHCLVFQALAGKGGAT